MIRINKYKDFYECTFVGGNLYAFSLIDLFSQLKTIYNISLPSLFNFENLN
jgi:hypothetical protein